MITIQELADKYGVSHQAIRYRLNQDDAPKGQRFGNMWLYDEADFKEWTFKRRRKSLNASH